MNNKKFIFTAQGYGFGPTSKAGSIAAYLKMISGDIPIDFMGDGISLDLANSKKDLFNQIYQVRNEFEIDDVLHKENYDKLISVMEPKSVVIAKAQGTDIISIDSLFWFWNWDSILRNTSIKGLREKFFGISIDDLIKQFSKIHPHETQLIGHILADKTFIQAYPNSYSRPDINLDEIGDVEIVGPIIDDTYLNHNSEQNRLMISFCGQKNSEVGIKESIEYWYLFSSLAEVC